MCKEEQLGNITHEVVSTRALSSGQDEGLTYFEVSTKLGSFGQRAAQGVGFQLKLLIQSQSLVVFESVGWASTAAGQGHAAALCPGEEKSQGRISSSVLQSLAVVFFSGTQQEVEGQGGSNERSNS